MSTHSIERVPHEIIKCMTEYVRNPSIQFLVQGETLHGGLKPRELRETSAFIDFDEAALDLLRDYNTNNVQLPCSSTCHLGHMGYIDVVLPGNRGRCEFQYVIGIIGGYLTLIRRGSNKFRGTMYEHELCTYTYDICKAGYADTVEVLRILGSYHDSIDPYDPNKLKNEDTEPMRRLRKMCREFNKTDEMIAFRKKKLTEFLGFDPYTEAHKWDGKVKKLRKETYG